MNKDRYQDPEIKRIYEKMKQCPISKTLDLVGDKFTILILRNMIYHKQTRFNQFLDGIENLHPKTLSKRLKDMEKDGLITRLVNNNTPIKIEYCVTDKGRALKPLIDIMATYSSKYFSEDIFHDGKPREFDEIFGMNRKTNFDD